MLLNSSIQVLFLGSIYTLSRKYQNLQISTGLDGRPMRFHHPLYYKEFILDFKFSVYFSVWLCVCRLNTVQKKKSQKKNKFSLM